MRTSAQDPSTPERAHAYALLQLTNGRAREVIELIKTLPLVQSVEAIRGPYQLIAKLSVDDAAPLRRIDGVERVVTAALAGDPGPKIVPAPDRRRRRGLAIPQPCGMPV